MQHKPLITLKGITHNSIIFLVNEQEHEIAIEKVAFENFFQTQGAISFQVAEKIYHINEIQTANFQLFIQQIAPKPKHLNHIPLALPPKVIGRKNDLEKVEELLFQDNALVIVNGIGGIGKTVLSHYYWQERQYKYTHLLWLKGDGNLEDSLIFDYNLHAGLGIVEEMKYHLEAIRQPNNAQAKEQAFACVATALKNVAPKGLMLIDNATAENHWTIKQWKTTFSNFHILVTSRIIFDDVATHSLGFLDKDEAKELFYLYYDADNQFPKNDKAVEEIIWFAGYHTLSIELLAKTLKTHKHLTFDSLLSQLHQNPVYLNKARKVGTPYTPTEDYIYNILELCFDISEITKYKNIENLLRCFSILPSYNIKAVDLEQMLNIIDENEETYLDTLEALVYNGWVQERYENEYIYDCHTIIQTIVRQKLKPNMANMGILVERLNGIIFTQGKGGINLHYTQKWLPYITQMLIYLHSNDKRILTSYINVGSLYSTIGNYNQSLIYHLNAVEIQEKISNNEDIELAVCCYNIANIYQQIGDFKQALAFNLKAIKIQEKTPNTNLGSFYGNLGSNYHLLGEYNKSLKIYEKAIQIEKNTTKESSIELARLYSGIASTYTSIGNYGEALHYELMGIEIQEKELERSHPLLAQSYNNIAITYKNIEQYDKSLTYILKAIEIHEALFGKSHPNISSYYNTLGNIYRHLEQYEKSIEAVSIAIEIQEKMIQKNFFKLGKYHNNLGNTYRCLKDYEKALFLYTKAIKMFENTVDKLHPEISIPYDNIASVYSDIQDWERAIKHEKQAIVICIKSLPLGSIMTAKYVDAMYQILKKAIQLDGYSKYKSEINWFHENCDQYLNS